MQAFVLQTGKKGIVLPYFVSSNPILTCVPSQKGFFLEPPHLQRAYGPRPAATLPSEFINTQAPSTSSGPFFTILISGEDFSASSTDLPFSYVRAPEGHLSMTDMISSELAPFIFTQGVLSWLNTWGRPFTHSLACTHFSGFHRTVSSPLVYSFILVVWVFFLLRFSAIYVSFMKTYYFLLFILN